MTTFVSFICVTKYKKEKPSCIFFSLQPIAQQFPGLATPCLPLSPPLHSCCRRSIPRSALKRLRHL